MRLKRGKAAWPGNPTVEADRLNSASLRKPGAFTSSLCEKGINKMKRTTQNSVGFVFIHGAGLGSWIWNDLVKSLEYPFLSIDLPARGKNKNMATKELSLENYVQSVVSDIDQFSTEKLIIAAHSISGVIGLEISQLLQNRIGGFVAISASIPSAVCRTTHPAARWWAAGPIPKHRARGRRPLPRNERRARTAILAHAPWRRDRDRDALQALGA